MKGNRMTLHPLTFAVQHALRDAGRFMQLPDTQVSSILDAHDTYRHAVSLSPQRLTEHEPSDEQARIPSPPSQTVPITGQAPAPSATKVFWREKSGGPLHGPFDDDDLANTDAIESGATAIVLADLAPTTPAEAPKA